MADEFCIIERGLAGEDLTGWQNRAVKINGSSSEEVFKQVSPTNVESIGILQNAPADTEVAKFVFAGFCYAKVGAVLEPYDMLAVDTDGMLIKATTNDCIFAQYIPKMEDGANGPDTADGDLARVFIFSDKRALSA